MDRPRFFTAGELIGKPPMPLREWPSRANPAIAKKAREQGGRTRKVMALVERLMQRGMK